MRFVDKMDIRYGEIKLFLYNRDLNGTRMEVMTNISDSPTPAYWAIHKDLPTHSTERTFAVAFGLLLKETAARLGRDGKVALAESWDEL